MLIVVLACALRCFLVSFLSSLLTFSLWCRLVGEVRTKFDLFSLCVAYSHLIALSFPVCKVAIMHFPSDLITVRRR
jgi:hypothetical protein